MPTLSAPNIGGGLCGRFCIDIASPVVCVDGVEGAEGGEGKAVLPVPELLAGPPEDETGCLLFLPIWVFDGYQTKSQLLHIAMNHTQQLLLYSTNIN
mgnify:CR=1 FL=1